MWDDPMVEGLKKQKTENPGLSISCEWEEAPLWNNMPMSLHIIQAAGAGKSPKEMEQEGKGGKFRYNEVAGLRQYGHKAGPRLRNRRCMAGCSDTVVSRWGGQLAYPEKLTPENTAERQIKILTFILEKNLTREWKQNLTNPTKQKHSNSKERRWENGESWTMIWQNLGQKRWNKKKNPSRNADRDS